MVEDMVVEDEGVTVAEVVAIIGKSNCVPFSLSSPPLFLSFFAFFLCMSHREVFQETEFSLGVYLHA